MRPGLVTFGWHPPVVLVCGLQLCLVLSGSPLFLGSCGGLWVSQDIFLLPTVTMPSHSHSLHPVPYILVRENMSRKKKPLERETPLAVYFLIFGGVGRIAAFLSCPESSSKFILTAYLFHVTRVSLQCVVRLGQTPTVWFFFSMCMIPPPSNFFRPQESNLY